MTLRLKATGEVLTWRSHLFTEGAMVLAVGSEAGVAYWSEKSVPFVVSEKSTFSLAFGATMSDVEAKAIEVGLAVRESDAAPAPQPSPRGERAAVLWRMAIDAFIEGRQDEATILRGTAKLIEEMR